ncbi:alpha,alpha-trehalose-phosphate synthase (UDP-forming) [Plastorhodobacter daqingensis]|uniref:Trehalose-6-phosphate synthase n=1 Tax=Plastorhodobacter daqingensis TaxID=1387281 RepID=A0ABW2UL08_9RHOB
MSRLVVVSNRVPLPDKAGNPPAGGLAVALHAALRERGGIWMGWSGKSTGEDEPGPLSIRENGAIQYALTDLTDRDVAEYYNGFANRVLWPICHSRIDLTEYARREMAGYFRVNRLFADRLVPLLRPDDVIWVHDYHLIPLAEELRRRGVRNRIGFFLHIPWPPADIFFSVPVYEAILRGLCAYDVVGFQTDYDVENFAGCLRREGVGEPLGGGRFRAFGRSFVAGDFPIGMETAEFAAIAAKSPDDRRIREMARSLGGRDLLIGVDRLDYSKGIPQRIEAYERFLRSAPEYMGKVIYLQVTPASRSEVPEYASMQETVASEAGRLNGALGTVDWVPMRYINRSIRRPVLAGLYRLAKVGLVTPLRDGMNLVAKEFVAAQDPEDPGVLVLSRFAGAARELDSALLINPHDAEGTAKAIQRALSMPLDERRERWDHMMKRLLSHDVVQWCADFMAHLEPPTHRFLPEPAPAA